MKLQQKNVQKFVRTKVSIRKIHQSSHRSLAIKFELKHCCLLQLYVRGKMSVERGDRFLPFVKLSAANESARSFTRTCCVSRAIRIPRGSRPVEKGTGGGERTSRFHGSSTCIGSGRFFLITGPGDTSQGAEQVS